MSAPTASVATPIARPRNVLSLSFHRKQCVQQSDRFPRYLRRRFLRFHELPSRMRPTASASNGIAGYHPVISTVAIGQQNLGVLLQKLLGSVATPTQREVEHIVRIRFVADVYPHACGMRMARAQHRQRGVVRRSTCDFRTRSAMRWYNGSTTSAASPHHTDCVAREISKPCRSKISSSRYRGR